MPLLTTPDVAADIELAESLSMATMLILETLSPTERAVFVLREVFDIGYDHIAAAGDKTPAAVRRHRNTPRCDFLGIAGVRVNSVGLVGKPGQSLSPLSLLA